MHAPSKLYVEFTGPVGSGKSVIARRVRKILEENDKTVVSHAKEQPKLLAQIPRYYKYLAPIFVFPLTTARILLFYIRNVSSLQSPMTRGREKDPTNTVLKRLLRDGITFARYDFDLFLNEGLLSTIPFNNPEIPVSQYTTVLHAYPGQATFLIFVDTPPSVACERMRSRKNPTSTFLQRVYDDQELEEHYQKGYEALKRCMRFAEADNKSTKPITVIRVDGTSSPDENASSIANILLSQTQN